MTNQPMPLKIKHALTGFAVLACTSMAVISFKHNLNTLHTAHAIANIHLKSSAYSKDAYAPISDSTDTQSDKLNGKIGVYASVGQTVIYKYVVGKNDSVQSIAKLMHTPVTTITDMNNREVSSIEPNDQLLIHVLKTKKTNSNQNNTQTKQNSTSDDLSKEIDNLLKDTKQLSNINYNDDSIYSSSGSNGVSNVDSNGKLLNSSSASNLSQFKAHGYTGNNAGTGYDAGLSSQDVWAKHWIAFHESSNSYTARNGRYIGKYQLDENYLKGDWSPANQERVATQYMKSRYGSWTNAQKFWAAHNWW